MDNLEMAQELLRMVPLPDDVWERMDALYEAAEPLVEKPRFAQMYEALAVLTNGG